MDRRRWQRLVAQFESSDLTQQEFADDNGINVATFRGWLYRLRRERTAHLAASLDFVEVEAARVTRTHAARVACCIVAGAMEIQFAELPPAQWVAEVIDGHRGATC